MDSASRARVARATARKPVLMRVGVSVFAVGLLCVLTVFALFAAGLENLPIALSAAAGVLTPLGLALGLISVVLEARRGIGTGGTGTEDTSSTTTGSAER